MTKAIEEKTKFSDFSESTADIHYLLGLVLFQSKRFSDATYQFTLSLKIRSRIFGIDSLQVADVLFAKGRTHAANNDNQEAIRTLQEAYRLKQIHAQSENDQNLLEIESYLGMCYYFLGQFDASIYHIENVQKQSIANNSEEAAGNAIDLSKYKCLSFQGKGDYKAARACLLKELAAYPKNKINYTNIERVEILEQIGELEQKVGRYNHALDAFHEVQKERNLTNTDNTLEMCILVRNIGLCYFNLNNFNSALNHFSKSVTLNILVHGDMTTPVSQSKVNKALTLQSIGQHNQALKLYLEVLRYPSLLSAHEISNVHTKIGKIYLEFGDEKRSYEMLMIATGILDDCLKIEDLDFASNERIVLDAIESYEYAEMVLKSNNKIGEEDYVRIYLKLGDLNIFLKNYKAGLVWLKKTVVIQEKMIDNHDNLSLAATYYNIGNCLYNMGNINECILFHDRSLEINRRLGRKSSTFTDSMYSLGLAHQKNGSYQESIKFFKSAYKIVSLSHNNNLVSCILQGMGFSLHLAGYRDEANDACTDALRLQQYGSEQKDTNTALILFALGSIHSARDNFERAIHYMQSSLNSGSDIISLR